jgi:hypothetical protein
VQRRRIKIGEMMGTSRMVRIKKTKTTRKKMEKMILRTEKKKTKSNRFQVKKETKGMSHRLGSRNPKPLRPDIQSKKSGTRDMGKTSIPFAEPEEAVEVAPAPTSQSRGPRRWG